MSGTTDKATGRLKEAAGALTDDDKLRKEMGLRARESAITRYRTDVVIPQYIEFYEQAIAKQSV